MRFSFYFHFPHLNVECSKLMDLIQIYEGESQISANNRYLGQVILSDLEPGPAGFIE